MSDRSYTRDEEDRIARALREDGEADCPRCGSAMETVDVPPRSEVAYVRDRLWLTCSGCGRRVVFDKRRLEG